MTRAEILALLDRRQTAFDRHDAVAIAALHADNGVVESLLAGTVTGRRGIADVYQTFFDAFPDMVMTIDDVFIDGDHATQVAMVTGTDMGGFMGVPATRKPFRLPIVFLYTFKDGAIAHERRIYDFTGLLVQIGVLKAKPA